MGAGLELDRIRYAYRNVVLTEATLTVAAGSAVALVGANGSGKTTLLRIAAGLRAPHGGTATLRDGTPVQDARRDGRIAYIPQQLGLVRHATALENAGMGALAKVPWWRAVTGSLPPQLREQAREALHAVGLAGHENTRVRNLSGGERQRVAVARALVQAPEVLVADELTASLDPNMTQQVLSLLDRLRSSTGCTVLASMHNAPAALRWADQVAILRKGTVLPLRPPSELSLEELQWSLG